MNCAPILIITLNRYEHLKRCIESLQKNKYATETDLYIGVDYPPNEKYEDGYRKILEYLDGGIDGFKNVIVLKQSDNKGPFLNFYELQKLVYEKYDRFIYSEDDNEFSLNYLEYMNKALEKYEKDENVLAISGYAYPIDTKEFSSNVFRCDSYFSALGYGMWKTKEEQMRKYLTRDYFEKLYKDGKYMNKLLKTSANQYANMVKGMLGYTPDMFYKGQIRELDLVFALYMQAFDMNMIFPVTSKVRNWGYDGSGVNCDSVMTKTDDNINHRNFNFENQKVDDNQKFDELIEENILTQQQINELMSKYFIISKKELYRTKIAYYVSRIIGLNNMRKIIGNKDLFTN